MKWGTRISKRTAEWHVAFAYIPTQVDHGVFRGQWIWLQSYWWRWKEPKSWYSDTITNADRTKPKPAS